MQNTASSPTECPVCHDGYIEPKLLSCNHLVCRKCIVEWLEKSGLRGGCPLCRASIIPLSSRQDSIGNAVDALPTDLVTVAKLESEQILNSHLVCKICGSGTAASSFCFQCGFKLCKSCASGHNKFPQMKNHMVELLTNLTPKQLMEISRSMCVSHDDRFVEHYCLFHCELICSFCATTSHRSCVDVKAIQDAAKEKRNVLVDKVQKMRKEEASIDTQIDTINSRFKSMRTRSKKMFDDLQDCIEKRRHAINKLIQVEEDSFSSILAKLKQDRAAIVSHAGTVENLIDSASDDALLKMEGQLNSRLEVIGQGTSVRDSSGMDWKDIVFDSQEVTQLKSSISVLGERRQQKATEPVWTTGSTVLKSALNTRSTPVTNKQAGKNIEPITCQDAMPPPGSHTGFPQMIRWVAPVHAVLAHQNPYRLNTTRNTRAGVQPCVMSQAPPLSVIIPKQEPLTASMLAAVPPQEQKQMLGERLFPLIQCMHPNLAGKITDMLLKLDNSELLHMLGSHGSLKTKVEEAVAVLWAHQVKEAATSFFNFHHSTLNTESPSLPPATTHVSQTDAACCQLPIKEKLPAPPRLQYNRDELLSARAAASRLEPQLVARLRYLQIGYGLPKNRTGR